MTGRTLPITGDCLCGAVRPEATVTPIWAAHRHGRMCRKTCGPPFGRRVGSMVRQWAARLAGPMHWQ